MQPVQPTSIPLSAVQRRSDDEEVDLDAILEQELAGLDAPDEVLQPTLPVPDQGPMVQQQEQLCQMLMMVMQQGLMEQCKLFKENHALFLQGIRQSDSTQISKTTISFPYPEKNLGEEERILVLDLTKIDQATINLFVAIQQRASQASEQEAAQLEDEAHAILERFIREGKAEIREKPKPQLSDVERGKRLQLLREIGIEGEQTAPIANHPRFSFQATIAFYSYVSAHQECISAIANRLIMHITQPDDLISMLSGNRQVFVQFDILKSCLEKEQLEECKERYRTYLNFLSIVLE